MRCVAKVHSPRAWDRYDAYLFDIDGTLLECRDATHYFAFCSVLESIAGRPLTLEGVTAHGNTDIGILRDALRQASIPDAAWRERLPEFVSALCRHVTDRKSNLQAASLPAVRPILDHLQSHDAVLGVATGNLEAIGKLKLEHCGLLSYFAFGAFSDRCEYRNEVFRAGVEMARKLAGDGAALCVVGDTPADIQAAHANGMDVIAVATGVYPLSELAAEKPEWCILSLADLSVEG